MRPFDRAWMVLKNNPHIPEEKIYPSLHAEMSDQMVGIKARPRTFENRQFDVKTIEDEDTRGRVRDTYNELEPANFSTGDEMARRLSANERAAQEEDPDDYDYRSKTRGGMRINTTSDYPALSHDDMDPRLMYPYPKNEYAGRSDFETGYMIEDPM